MLLKKFLFKKNLKKSIFYVNIKNYCKSNVLNESVVLEKFISFLKLENICFQSFITLTFPLETTVNNVKAFKFFIRFLRKSHHDLLYLYVYELVNEKNFHIHVLVTPNFEKNFFQLKEKWLEILQLSHKKKDFLVQVLDFKKIDLTNYDINIKKLINYMVKSLNEPQSLSNLNKFLKLKNYSLIENVFGGSKIIIQKFFQSIKIANFNQTSSGAFFLKERVGTTKNLILDCLDNTNYKNKFDYCSIPSNYDLLVRELNNELSTVVDFATKFDINYVLTSLGTFTDKQIKRNASKFASIYQFSKLISKKLEFKFLKKIISLYSEKNKNKNTTWVGMYFSNIAELETLPPGLFLSLMLVFVNGLLTLNSLLSLIEALGNNILTLFKKTVKSVFVLDTYSTETVRGVGHVTFEILKPLFETVVGEIHVNTFLDLNRLEQFVDYSTLSDITFAVTPNKKKISRLDDCWQSILKTYLTSLTAKEAMITPPLDWVAKKPVKISQTEDQTSVVYYDAGEIINGGFLLNEFFLKNPLLKKTSVGTSVSLKVTQSLINLINKLQQFVFKTDLDFFTFFYKCKTIAPVYITVVEKRNLIKKIHLLNSNKKQVFFEIKKLKDFAVLNGTTVDLKPLSTKISEIDVELADLVGRLSKAEQFIRVIELFKKFQNDTLYYVYNLDFRGRIYPANIDMHPMGNKYAKAFVSFKDAFSFDLNEFKKFAVSAFQKTILKSEVDLLSIFDLVLKPKLLNFRTNLKEIFQFAENPLMFLKCCFEYEKYLQACNKNQLYLSSMPIYLDATSSGPQVLSLFYGIETYASFLNLTNQNTKTTKGDFYIGLIVDFIVNYLPQHNKKDYIDLNKFNTNLEYKDAVLFLLRKGLKKTIMTQFYGVTNYKCLNEYNDFLVKEKEQITKLGLWEKLSNGDFIKDFLYFIKKVNLFQLKALLEFLIDKLGQKPLVWSIFDNAEIEVKYQQIKRSFYTPRFLNKRHQYTFLSVEQTKMSSKQKTAAMANFVHSIDGYIMGEVIKRAAFPIIPIHDCWGVPMNKVTELRQLIRVVYSELIENNVLFNKMINQFETYLKENVSELVSVEFREFVEQNQRLGSMTKKDVLNSEYIVFYDN